MKKSLNFLSSLVLAIISTHTFGNENLSFNATLTSDYLFRGVSQTDSSPAIQAGLNYDFANGFYTGAWASNVDFGDDANLEIDGYLGYAFEMQNGFSVDVLFNYYTYQGYPSEVDVDYSELILSASKGAFNYTFGYAPSYGNSDLNALYIGIDYSLSQWPNYDVTLHGGYSFGDAFDGSEYVDMNISVGREFEGYTVSGMLSTTDADTDVSDTRIVLAISKEF